MRKLTILRQLWRNLQHRPKIADMRTLQTGPRKTPSNIYTRFQFFLTDSTYVAVPAIAGVATLLFIWDQEKEQSLFKKQCKQEVIPLPNNVNNLANKEMKYRPIQVIGEFDHRMERYIQPRRCVTSQKGSGVLLFSKAENIGMFVVTPFTIKETGQRILVNRGWIPTDKKDPESRLEGQVTGEVKIVGHVQHTEQESFASYTQRNDPKTFRGRNVEGLARSTNSLPVYLDASSDSTVEGGPIGGQISPEFKQNNGYYLASLYVLALMYLVVRTRKWKVSGNSKGLYL
ncbi:surfeit locus protein 1-like [Ylistrum balloti]|uniref:surfeit locus protein 1-like n=1 Tax=Ylistrum balloti TaxID=509963 RepID=UPI002905CDE0|nr:surfeit locus protein 1-like [Ylistrum balloti]